MWSPADISDLEALNYSPRQGRPSGGKAAAPLDGGPGPSPPGWPGRPRPHSAPQPRQALSFPPCGPCGSVWESETRVTPGAPELRSQRQSGSADHSPAAVVLSDPAPKQSGGAAGGAWHCPALRLGQPADSPAARACANSPLPAQPQSACCGPESLPAGPGPPRRDSRRLCSTENRTLSQKLRWAKTEPCEGGGGGKVAGPRARGQQESSVPALGGTSLLWGLGHSGSHFSSPVCMLLLRSSCLPAEQFPSTNTSQTQIMC